MKAGAAVKDLYDTALEMVKSKKPELADKFVKNIGFGVSKRSVDGAGKHCPLTSHTIG
jgi:nucleosome binding factor SPN SPT16 subunit